MTHASSSADKQTVDDEYEELAQNQRLKAAVFYSVVQICKQVEEETGCTINKQVTASISELTCKQFENVASDLELFAKHAKRSTINTDDVKLLVRKTPNLLEHLNSMHDTSVSKPGGNKGKKKSSNKSKKAVLSIDDTTEDTMDAETSLQIEYKNQRINAKSRKN